MKPCSRSIFLLIFLSCAGLMAFGLWLQHVQQLEPCALCILQRYAFVGVGLIALAAALHRPGKTGTLLYSGGIVLTASAGGSVAAWQSWLQRFPSQSLECGPGLEYTLQSFSLAEALPMIFKGGGDCAKVQWRWLSLSLPEWALIWFVLFALLALWLMLRGRRLPG
jgi:disulfide bond formation protein DsbB